MKVTHSVSTRIAHYLFLIIVFSGIITALSLAIMASNKSDAELINVSGSLRMQAYRLIYMMEHEPQKVDMSLSQYRLSLHSNALLNISRQRFAPQELKQAYHNVIRRWGKMEAYARQNNLAAYRKEVGSYVTQVDNFVYILQNFAEKKLTLVVMVTLFSMLLIVAMVSYVIWYTRRKVVNPLHQLVQASTQMQMRQFNHIQLDTTNNNELGTLAKAFTHMSAELFKFYTGLEQKVNEKTQKLNQTNRALSILYHCSQQLSVTDINRALLQKILHHVMATEHLRVIEIIIDQAEHWNIRLGAEAEKLSWQEQNISIGSDKLGVLRWQAGLPCPDTRTMSNIAQLLGRALYFHQTQRQQQQLLLMEERSIIARELHDSLAQVLSFLRIQLTLLKHNLNLEDKNAKQKSLQIIQDFEQALSNGYIQLRELLTTFRLTVQEANLQLALEQVIDSLRNQTEIPICLQCALPSQLFNPQQLIHALQIIREAVLNAIKHAEANCIEVIAHVNEDGENELLVRDDGIGIPSLEEPAGHYGLNIMQERCRQLNASLCISNRASGGTEVKVILPDTIN
ncbi:two-component system nitrate/nitrite sensor histidine kinase NarQ [Mesocricetibacter intestinalis]|uniref:Sensor protein n=1 Tax=Mesocricetibacter intestinalis TaxID=1521930 RepID=A0A4R6V6W2_9PAST|nr:nitrate/nitrite two-component system sensor histidine kinase NarQ [Mesocricetibacter intestinalis]TDQ56650.1 two-component system nitrate/nitrite sensor histidine kinase NarQ [Mesocricetibacter intestinalis]